MSSYISDFIFQNENLPFSFENQFKRFSYITIFPNQANASGDKNENGVYVSWFQLVAQFKVTYDAVNENGEVLKGENAITKTLIIKFTDDYMRKFNLNGIALKDFFNTYFVGKRFITLPVTEEMPVYEYKNNTRNLIKNQSQVYVVDDFNLTEFIEFIKNQTKSKK
ncbi:MULTISPECIES: hypothetical protein [unclassified Campylobacter]|uniref:hypothetical protein n=1 Tax=unclassified Campylobacter TaxID=2593542 RepID=UPI0022E9A612|nr:MULTISPECIES: hypothetical protein [unclassified Campylobacter]MDA3054317.1 hypothetical protein [Campylobacter sp. VBCF_07 NA4]MDA3061009.1 hypothetical protein [Campylobacter sp. VBCF_02 NA5]MDA3070523.1 hypothetical protein [Campylobacter sp. VBCF_08 NA3]WBR53826.1 hypothetical protein PF027_05740 [Campylobacter sp. VBCF_01 NA2]